MFTYNSNTIIKKVKIVTKDKFYTLLKKGDAKKVTQIVNFNQNITAPITKGDVLGSIDFYLDNEKIGQTEIVADSTVDKMTFFTAFLWILDGLLE